MPCGKNVSLNLCISLTAKHKQSLKQWIKVNLFFCRLKKIKLTCSRTQSIQFLTI